MIGLYVSVPIACFRHGLSRDYWETYQLPPPSTCYGFLLSLVGEEDRMAHVGVRIAPALLNSPDKSTVLRTVWRIKSKTPGQGNNMTPVEQELLTGMQLAIWVDSSGESRKDNLEAKIRKALVNPQSISRFGALCFGESTHVVNEVRLLEPDKNRKQDIFLLDQEGEQSLPVWVNHVGSKGTRYVKGSLVKCGLSKPESNVMPMICVS